MLQLKKEEQTLLINVLEHLDVKEAAAVVDSDNETDDLSGI